MITTNVFQRTFHIRFGNATGTGFAIDRGGKQYLVTARHVVENITSGQPLDIYHDKQWKSLNIEIVGFGDGQTDVAVLGCPVRLAPPYPLEASAAGLAYGQKVYFVGFPFGWDSGNEHMNHEFPLPFVKAGIVSALGFETPSRIFIDAHGNEGFSGGPVVFEQQNTSLDKFHVAGIVAEAPRPRIRSVVNKDGNPLVGNDGKPLAYFQENAGFVVAISIRHATKMIDANPIGFQLPTGEDS